MEDDIFIPLNDDVLLCPEQCLNLLFYAKGESASRMAAVAIKIRFKVFFFIAKYFTLDILPLLLNTGQGQSTISESLLFYNHIHLLLQSILPAWLQAMVPMIPGISLLLLQADA